MQAGYEPVGDSRRSPRARYAVALLACGAVAALSSGLRPRLASGLRPADLAANDEEIAPQLVEFTDKPLLVDPAVPEEEEEAE